MIEKNTRTVFCKQWISKIMNHIYIFIIDSIQLLNRATLANTENASFEAHLPEPWLVTPCNSQRPLLLQTNGPPLSPWQALFLVLPPSPAHSMWSVTCEITMMMHTVQSGVYAFLKYTLPPNINPLLTNTKFFRYRPPESKANTTLCQNGRPPKIR